MVRKLSRTVAFVLLIAVVCLTASCRRPAPLPSPTPEPELVRIPEWVKEPKDIEVWRRVSGADYVSSS